MQRAVIVMLALVTTVQAAERYPSFGGLEAGRATWLGTCEGCHALGIAGAPRVDRFNEWRARLKQGDAVLYQHALEGFFGPKGTMMPPRGGNEALADDEVRGAVDYMIRLVRHNASSDVE